MKKYLILILFAYLVPSYSFSQSYKYVPFPDSGAIWSEVYYYGEGSNFPDTSIKPPDYERFALSGEDTVINDVTYHKVYLFYDTVFHKENALYIGGIREDTLKRIYYTGDTILHPGKPLLGSAIDGELLLYDFSVNVGDTLREGNVNWEYMIVEKIDTVLIGKSLRKRYFFEAMTKVWIEGVGSTGGLLYAMHPQPTCSCDDNFLICFKQNDTILYFDDHYDDCMPVISGIERKEYKPDVRVYPNPVTSGMFHIVFGKQFRGTLEIFYATGRMLQRIPINGTSCTINMVERYHSGLYFLKIFNSLRLLTVKKLVVK